MNTNKILESCESISSQFSLHDWDYDFVLSREDKNEIEESLHNIRKVCEDSKDDLTFTNKEIKVLANYTKIGNGKLSIDLLIGTINISNYNDLLNNWKLNEKEIEEFKSKLERLVS